MRHGVIMRWSALILVGAAYLHAQTFEAIQKRRFASDRRGEIHITGEAIEFKAVKEKHSRRWTYDTGRASEYGHIGP